jgi:hypothetical protein
MITAEYTARRTHGLTNVRISGQTVRKRIRKSGLRARRAVLGPFLKQRHGTARLAWARACDRWKLHNCQHILFSDESRFSFRLSDGRYRVYRRRGARLTDQCVYESDQFGGGSVIVWDGICHDGRTQLKIVQATLNAVKYRDDLLNPIILQ